MNVPPPSSTGKLVSAGIAAICVLVALVPCCSSTTTRLLFGFLGAMLVLVLGTLAWLERIRKHVDLDAAGREQNKNSVVVAAAFFGTIMTGLLLVCLATTTVFRNGTATALLWAIGSLLGGGFVGFLFSLPKPVEDPPGTVVPGRRWQVNNSLNRLSDALTAALVGVTLVNATAIYAHFTSAAKHLAQGLAGTDADSNFRAAEAFAAGLIVAFILLGLLGTYLLTRLWISSALEHAVPGGSVFVETNVNERDLAILENETRSFSEKERGYVGAAADVAKRVQELPWEKLRTWREFAAWGKAKSHFEKHEDAEKAFVEAVQRYPESAELRLEFAVSLFLAARAVSATDDRRKQLNLRIRDELTEAYHRLNGKTPAEVCKNVYKSLTYYWLYQPAPRGFTNAAHYGEEYAADPQHLPSGGIQVNLACAYGQNAKWLMEQSGDTTPDEGLRKKVIQAIAEALRLDPAWSIKFQDLLQPASAAGADPVSGDDDLAAFAGDAEIRTLIGLPPKRRPKNPPKNNDPATPPAPAMKLFDPIIFQRRCDASAGIAISSTLWVGANDEENTLRLYSITGGIPLNDTLLDVNPFLGITGTPKELEDREVDFESAAALGDLVYWIGSHSQSRKHKDRPDRWLLMATKRSGPDEAPVLEAFGKPCKTLRETLVADGRLKDFNLATAITIAPKDENGFNIESLCAERGGERLLIGFRNPFSAGKALLVPLKNPRAVVEEGATPVPDDPILLDLGGLGFRDMVVTGEGYLILAGDYRDRNAVGARPSQLFAWSGPGAVPQKLDVDFGDLNPEALVVFAAEQKILIVSDDGARKNEAGETCKELAVEKRTFRAVILQGWWPFSDSL